MQLKLISEDMTFLFISRDVPDEVQLVYKTWVYEGEKNN